MRETKSYRAHISCKGVESMKKADLGEGLKTEWSCCDLLLSTRKRLFEYKGELETVIAFPLHALAPDSLSSRRH